MVVKGSNYGVLLNSLKYSENLDGSSERNLHVYASLYSKVSNLGNVLDYALKVNDYNKAPSGEKDSKPFKSPHYIMDFSVLYLVLNPKLIFSLDHVLHSVARALINVLNGKSVSTNFTSEVAFMLSGSSNVGKCLETVMLSKNDNSSPVLVVTLSQKKTKDSILDLVKGVEEDVSNLRKYSDVEEIVKEFKISDEEKDLPGGLEMSILGKIGVKRI